MSLQFEDEKLFPYSLLNNFSQNFSSISKKCVVFIFYTFFFYFGIPLISKFSTNGNGLQIYIKNVSYFRHLRTYMKQEVFTYRFWNLCMKQFTNLACEQNFPIYTNCVIYLV